MPDPTRQVLARASEASYSTTQTPTPDYERISELSSPDISTYKNKTQPVIIIAHRGTDFSSPTIGRQLKADFNVLIGNKKNDALHKARSKKTEDIIRKIRKTDQDSEIFLVGHSLGATSQTAMLRPFVRDNVKSVNLFNPASSPLGGRELSSGGKAYQEIAKKSTNHIIKGDLISENANNTLIGRVIKYNSKSKPSIGKALLDLASPLLEKSPLGKLASLAGASVTQTMESHSLKNFI
jgi:pimeloyl-ACP methyl ester carboxylesterase